MSTPMIVGLFLLLVFGPCVAAFFGSAEPDSLLPGVFYTRKSRRPARKGRSPRALDAALPEAELAEEFVVRTFAKGIAEHRFVVRDTESGVKLHIRQVREAAIELMKQSGMKAARELALIVAASAAAMSSVVDAVVIAATEALNAARRAYDWFAISETLAEERAVADLREASERAGPEFFAPDLFGPDSFALEQARQAALDRAKSSGERRALSDRWRRVEPRAA